MLEGRHHGGAARGLHGDQPRQVGPDPAKLSQFPQRLADRDQADAAADRAGDHFGDAPAKLLGDLEADGLLALDPVRLAQRGDILVAGPGGDLFGDQAARVPDEAVHQVGLGPGGDALGGGDRRRLPRHRDQAGQARPGTVGRPGGAGVAVGGHGHAGRAELGGAGHPDSGPPGLERPCRQRALVLDRQPGEPQLTAEPVQAEQRRHALAQRDHAGLRGCGEQFVVAPDRGRPPGYPGRTGRRRDRSQVIARQQRAAAAAGALNPAWLENARAPRAFQVAQRRVTCRHVASSRADPLRFGHRITDGSGLRHDTGRAGARPGQRDPVPRAVRCRRRRVAGPHPRRQAATRAQRRSAGHGAAGLPGGGHPGGAGRRAAGGPGGQRAAHRRGRRAGAAAAELVAALLAFGLAAGLLDVAANVHALRVQRAYQRPLISSFHAWYSGGAIGGALLGGAFAWASVSPAVSFAAVGIPLAGVALLAARGLLRGREEGIPETGDSERALPPGARAGAGAAGRSRHVSLRLLVLGVLAMCSLLGVGAAGNWSAVYLHDNLAAPAGLAAIGFAAFSAAMTAGRMAGDRLAARCGPVRLMRGAGLLAAAGLGGGLLSGDPAGAIVGFAVFGAGLSVTFPQLMWAAADADPLRPGSAVARVAGMGYVGLLGGPVLIGGCATMAGLTRALTIPMVLMVGLALAARAVARPAADRAVARPADAPAG